jgi:acyl-CoA synthetase (AMP-forming)/AMP-acid ligase II
VSPEEIEEVIQASDMTSEAVACGEPDPVSGAVIVAHVVPKDRVTFTTGELLSYCQREMPSYMVPRKVHVHDSLPRTTSGKLDRKALSK